MPPETKARQLIYQKLEQAGWVIQDRKQLNLGAAVGVIEASKDGAGANLTVTENQTERYTTVNPKWRKENTPLRRRKAKEAI